MSVNGVWSGLVGQQRAVGTLRRAVEAAKKSRPGASSGGAGATANMGAATPPDMAAMTHAWLLTGPPGSGRSVAARAFAAALECPDGGCGVCNTCRTALSGAHPDVTLCRTEQLSIGVDEVRELVVKAMLTPIAGPWQVIVIEDADRLTDRAADALLKSLEEPPPRTVWVLCAPSADDLIVTIRSRTREVRLVTPPDADVVRLLAAEGVAAGPALAAARASQGHIGRARALATDATAMQARAAIVDLPSQWTSISQCLVSAADVVGRAQAEATATTSELDAKERAELDLALGFGTSGTRSGTRVRPRSAATAVAQLEDQQKARAKRLQRDALDTVLIELTTWYRDVLAAQVGAPEAEFINVAAQARTNLVAESTTPARTAACLDAILAARRAIDGNVPPLLAMEALFVTLGGFS